MFGVLVFLTKRVFGFKVKNIDIYIYLSCILDYIHMQYASKCLNIKFLYLDEFLSRPASQNTLERRRDMSRRRIYASQKYPHVYMLSISISKNQSTEA